MKAAVLGAGDMGETVVDHLQKCQEIDGVTVYDIRKERLLKLADKYNVEISQHLDEVLGNRQISLVFVTASNDAHKYLTIRSLEAGKAVMCEKPMANTLSDALDMVNVAERHKGFLQIGFELRYSKLYASVKEWIDAGLLGEVVNTHCYYICCEFLGKHSWRVKTETGGSMFGEKLSHYVDLPRWWIGSDVKDVISICSPNVIPYYEIRDNYHTTYRFSNGAASHLTFIMGPAATFKGDPLQNFVSQQAGDGHHLRYLVVGTAGAAEADVFNRTLKRWKFSDAPDLLESHLLEVLTWDAEEDHFYFHNTTDQTFDIVYRVANGLPPKTSARDAYETMKLCFAAEESADTGEAVVLHP